MPDACIIPMQQKLYDLYDSGAWRRPIGAYGALKSQANATANPAEVSLVGKAEKGHVAKYQITYVPAECSDVIDCGETGSGICDAGSSKSVETDVKTISECFSLKNIEITTEQFRDLCNFGPQEWLTAQLVGRMDTGMREVNSRILSKLCAAAGSYAQGDSTTRILNLINSQLGTPRFGALHQVSQVFRKAGAPTNPILVGGETLDYYNYGMQSGGQTASGSNFSESRPPIFYDTQIDTECPVEGYESMLAFLPGVAQFVNYLYNVGDFQTNMGGDMDLMKLYQNESMYTKGVLEDPITGYLWDMSVAYNNCTDKWIINLSTNFDVWVMRLTQCYATDFTGILKYGVCPYTSPACDIGS